MPERSRAARGITFIDTVLQDVRLGCRILASNPGFSIIAVVSLAIGVGANTASFSLADTLLLRPLAVPRPAEVVTVGSLDVSASSQVAPLRASFRDYIDLRDRSKSFAGLTATSVVQVQFSEQASTTPEIRTGMLVSGNYFDRMEVRPALGRGFLPAEDQVPNRDAVIVLSHAFWERQFGADPTVLGRGVRVNGLEYTVVGVMPEGFVGTDQWIRPEFYLPVMMWPGLVNQGQGDPLEQRALRALDVKGRLRDGVSIEQAAADVASIGVALSRAYPETNRNEQMFVRTELQNRIQSGGTVALLGMMVTLAVAVLLVACANVAGLLTSRAPARTGEIALRLALGAGRGRLVRQLLIENTVLAAAGGAAGLAVGYAGVLLWRQLAIPSELPIEIVSRLDGRALAVSFAVAGVSVFLFGLLPAMQTTRASLVAAMGSAGRATVGRRQWGRSVLVAGQVALSLALLSVAAFVYISFLRQLDQGPGFRTDRLLMMRFNPSLSRYNDEQTRRFYEQLVERSREVTGVDAVSVVSFIPMSNSGAEFTAVIPERYVFPEGTESARIATNRVGLDYFGAMGIPIVRGRAFSTADTADTPRVAVVNQRLADRYWPGQDPIGKRFRIAGTEGSWVEVVGLVPTGRYFGISETPMEFLYLQYEQHPPTRMTLLVQSAGEPLSLVEPIRGLVRGLDPEIAVGDVRTMTDFYYGNAIGNFLVIMRAVAAMGVMGVTLSFVGLYGLVAYGVSRRTREIGLRMAIGASQGSVLRMVLRQGLTLAAIGLVVGLVLTVGADRALRAAFPGGSGGQRGITEYLITTTALLAITALAAYLPARRAAHIEPTRALRYE